MDNQFTIWVVGVLDLLAKSPSLTPQVRDLAHTSPYLYTRDTPQCSNSFHSPCHFSCARNFAKRKLRLIQKKNGIDPSTLDPEP